MIADRVKIISEVGINHDGSLGKALEMIRVSAECGADVCKFQLLKASEMYSRSAGTYENASGKFDIYDVVEKSELQDKWIPRLIEECNHCGVEFLTTVYDLKGLEEILPYHPKLLKMASYEISHLPLLRAIGTLQIPLIISSAGSSLGDIEEAVEAYGNESNLCIMHCNGKYPTPREMINMGALKTLELAFPDAKIGYSDHTEDPVEAPVAAVILGARTLEKHFTLDKNSSGPDHSFAVDPDGLRSLVDAVRSTEERLAKGESIKVDPVVYGSTRKVTQESERYIRNFSYRYLYAKREIEVGEFFSLDNVAILRAGELKCGFHPRMLDALSSIRSICKIEAGSPIDFESLLR